MGRPKQFDPDEAAQEAMEAFWERGYAATSVNDLLDEMGLNKGSLYGTFGDKKQLFLAALEKYSDQRTCAVTDILEQKIPARKVLEELLDFVAHDCTGENAHRGCLAAKAAMELAPHDKDVAGWLKKFHRRNVQMVARVIERGQKEGDISKKLDATAAARFFLNNFAGMRLLGTINPSISELKEVAQLVLTVLD